MASRLILSISKTLLMARLKQSVVAAAGVTFGITMFITLMGFMTGLNGMLDGLILNRTPHIRLYNEVKASEDQPVYLSPEYKDQINNIRSIKPRDDGKEIYDGPAIVAALRNDPRVFGVAAKVVAPVFYNVGATDITGSVNGIDVTNEEALFAFSTYVPEGDITDLNNINNSVILGKGLADKMLAEIGDIVPITTARGQQMNLKVVGFYQSGLADVDNITSFASIGTTQKLLGKTDSYLTDIQVKLHDLNQAPALAKEFQAKFGTEAIDIQTANSQFDTGTQIRNIITYSVSIVLLVVAGFGIYNILNMMIYEKMDSIAILKATGFSGNDVRNIFINLSLIIGISGGLLGLGLGFIFQVIIDHLPFETSALPTIKTFPVNYNPRYYGIGILFALVTTFLAGWFPARKASKIDPVIIIRGK
jgi:lipoprotein-releasing system permease protein